MNLSHKTILITGGNSGIGFSLSKQLHAMGNQIVVISRSQKNWDTLPSDGEVITLQCDLSKQADVVSLTEQLQQQKIIADLIINCAAIQLTPTFIDDEFDFSRIGSEVNTNFTAIAWLSYLLLPMLMSRPESAIVNISSGLAIYPKTSSAIYCATKAALHSFSQSLRYQLIDTPVQVTEILLPLVDTTMTAGRGSGKISATQAAQKIITGIQSRKAEVYIGKARLLPMLARLSPSLTKRILRDA